MIELREQNIGLSSLMISLVDLTDVPAVFNAFISAMQSVADSPEEDELVASLVQLRVEFLRKRILKNMGQC